MHFRLHDGVAGDIFNTADNFIEIGSLFPGTAHNYTVTTLTDFGILGRIENKENAPFIYIVTGYY